MGVSFPMGSTPSDGRALSGDAVGENEMDLISPDAGTGSSSSVFAVEPTDALEFGVATDSDLFHLAGGSERQLGIHHARKWFL